MSTNKLFSALLVSVTGLAFCIATACADEGSTPAENPATAGAAPSAAVTDGAAEVESLSSSSVAQRLYELAFELSDSPQSTQQQAQEAMILLSASRKLSDSPEFTDPLLIKLTSKASDTDRAAQVYSLLSSYISDSADLEVVRMGITYLLERLDSRKDREKLLARLYSDFSGSNEVLDSELSTLMATLAAEKGDLETAQKLLARAYKVNRYNRIAFKKLVELDPSRISPPAYFEHLRLLQTEDPADIDAAVNFAQYAEQLQLYDVAAESYRYSTSLFAYLYPTDRLPSHIYLPWAMAAYNTEKNQPVCMQIAKAIRQGGRFDLLLEAIAGRSAMKTGNAEEAERILSSAALRAEQMLKSPSADLQQAEFGPKQIAWFYSFASVDVLKAMDWANNAYSAEPNSPAAAAILAYTLVLKDQHELAKHLVTAPQKNQIAMLVSAMIQLKEGKTDPAIDTLKAAIAKDPGSLAAEQAKQLLIAQGLEYIPAVDPKVLRTVMDSIFGETFIPTFTKPENAITVQFNVRGNKFAYGGRFGANIAIVNNSAEPLIVSDYGLFKGNIRIDADVTGDIKKKIPGLVSMKVRSAHKIEPSASVMVPVELITGDLRQLLVDHPQASLNIKFSLYLDPVVDGSGRVLNRLVNLKPATVTIARPGIELTGTYLRNRFNSISTGQQGQKIKTAQLFIGLLKEQQIMSRTKPTYRFRYADWMPPLLKDALLHESGLLRNPGNGEWVVKVHTMADMLDIELDQELTAAVAENINNANWPVRLMSMYLLSKAADGQFDKVLAWAAQNDSSQIVRDMASALIALPQ